MKLLIQIPCLNERDHLGDTFADLPRALPGIDSIEVLVVDDGSDDATRHEAFAAGAEVITLPVNLGYGSALQTGYLYAREQRVERLVQIDADGQHEAAGIIDLLAALDRGCDVALGSRYLTAQPPSVGWARRLGARVFGRIATMWTGVRITDPTSGFQALSDRAIAHLVRDSFPEDYPDTDVLIDLHRAGLKIAEVPVRMYPRRGGTSMHRGGRVAFYAYKMLMNLSLLPVRRMSPFRAGRAAG